MRSRPKFQTASIAGGRDTDRHAKGVPIQGKRWHKPSTQAGTETRSVSSLHSESGPLNWVAVKEPNLDYHNGDICTHN